MLLDKKKFSTILLALVIGISFLGLLSTIFHNLYPPLTNKGERLNPASEGAHTQAHSSIHWVDAYRVLEPHLNGLLYAGRNVRTHHAKQTRKEAIVAYLQQNYKQPETKVWEYVELAWQQAEQYDMIEPELLLAVMQKESSLRDNARNRYGAQGLMQVVPRWHPEKLKRGESVLSPELTSSPA